MPAHSQLLAAASRIIQNLMLDSHTFSREQPLVLDQQLRGFSETDLQTFLNHVYLNSDLASPAAAHALLKVADLFDAKKVMETAITCLEKVPAGNVFATTDDVLHWLLLAERFNLASLLKKSANHAAMRYKDVCNDPRFHQQHYMRFFMEFTYSQSCILDCSIDKHGLVLVLRTTKPALHLMLTPRHHM